MRKGKEHSPRELALAILLGVVVPPIEAAFVALIPWLILSSLGVWPLGMSGLFDMWLALAVLFWAFVLPGLSIVTVKRVATWAFPAAPPAALSAP
jgi:hypothetical protein